MWWTSVFPWNMLHSCSDRQSSSLREDPHRPSTSPGLTAQDKAGVCNQPTGQKEPALWTQDIIMNNHKPREALQHTEVEQQPDKVIPTFSFLYPTSLTFHLNFINFHLLKWKPASRVTSVYWDSCIITNQCIFLYFYVCFICPYSIWLILSPSVRGETAQRWNFSRLHHSSRAAW